MRRVLKRTQCVLKRADRISFNLDPNEEIRKQIIGQYQDELSLWALFLLPLLNGQSIHY